MRAWAAPETTSWWNRRASAADRVRAGHGQLVEYLLGGEYRVGGERGDAPGEAGHERVQVGVGQGVLRVSAFQHHDPGLLARFQLAEQADQVVHQFRSMSIVKVFPAPLGHRNAITSPAPTAGQIGG